jgi:hypothetical protein
VRRDVLGGEEGIDATGGEIGAERHGVATVPALTGGDAAKERDASGADGPPIAAMIEELTEEMIEDNMARAEKVAGRAGIVPRSPPTGAVTRLRGTSA